MLSLNKCFNEIELLQFIENTNKKVHVNNLEFVAEPKVDGIAFSATYKKGKLKSVATRGNGLLGENITNNFRQLPNSILHIDSYLEILEVRGEIYVEEVMFNKTNLSRELMGLPLYKNTRNFVSGMMRQTRGSDSLNFLQNLTYVVYGVGFSSQPIGDTHAETMTNLNLMGFPVFKETITTENPTHLLMFYRNYLLNRKKKGFDADGIVFKVNNLQLHNILGVSTNAPLYAIAFKFPAIIAETELISIEITVGRTGKITPVAIVKTILVGGVEISRATLDNYKRVSELGIRIGDVVYLERAADVIPKINKVNLDKRKDTAVIINAPVNCPSCNSPLHEIGRQLFCLNTFSCPSIIKNTILHFVSPDGFNIKGLGPKTIESFIDNKIIRSCLDIFYIKEKRSNILGLKGWTDRKLNNLIVNIEGSKLISLKSFIYSLNIKEVGLGKAEKLANQLKTPKVFYMSVSILVKQKKTRPVFMEILGKSSYKHLVDFFSKAENLFVFI